MNFSERPPSKQWATLKIREERIAEVWFKPEGESFGLRFRLPQRSFQIPGIVEQLTTKNLLSAVGIRQKRLNPGAVTTTQIPA